MYLSYCFPCKSGKQHNRLKLDLQKEFTTGYGQYPDNKQVTLMIIYKYTKSSVSQQTTTEGTPFAQRDGTSNKHIPPYDKIY